MKISWIGLAAGFLSLTLSAQEAPRQLKFSAAEQQIWQLTLQRPVGESAQILASLRALAFPLPAQQALLWVQRCRFALQTGDKVLLEQARSALKVLESTAAPGEFAGSGAGYKCQQLSKFSGGESMETRQLGFLAYHSLTSHDTPALHAWIGLDYARDALATGFIDSAANAVGLVSNIARQNRLAQLESDSLSIQAQVQSAQGHYAEALRSIDKALSLTAEPAEKNRLALLQADVLYSAGRTADAEQLYLAQWQQHSLPAGLALLNLYLDQDKTAAALPLSIAVQQAAAQNGNREWMALSRLRQAMVLLGQEQSAAAQELFQNSRDWLMQHRLALYLPEHLRWARLLARHGQQDAAIAALQQGLQLQRQLDADNDHTQAQLSSTLIIAEQRSRELKLVDLQQQLNISRTKVQAKEQQLLLLSGLCAGLALLLLGLLWRRISR